MKLLRRHKLILIALGIYWPVIFWLTHIPVPDLARQSGMSDKTMHVLAYFVLTFLAWFAVSPYQKVCWNHPKVWILLAVIPAYAVLDEYLQGLVGRSADILDFISDMFGLVLGLGILSMFSFWPALLVLSAGFIFVVSTMSQLPGLYPQYHLSTVFHLTAYTCFALIWMQVLDRYTQLRVPTKPWLFFSLSGPFFLLVFIDAAAVLSDRLVEWLDFAAALLGSASAVLISCLRVRLSRKAGA